MQRVRASTEFAGSHAPAPTRTPRAAPGCLQCQSRSAPRGVLCDSQPARKNLPRASPARGPLVWGGAWLKPMRCDLQALVLAQRGAGRAPLTCDARHAIRAWASLQARPEKSCLRVPGQNSMTQRRPDAPTPRSSGPPAKHFIVPPPPPLPPIANGRPPEAIHVTSRHMRTASCRRRALLHLLFLFLLAGVPCAGAVSHSLAACCGFGLAAPPLLLAALLALALVFAPLVLLGLLGD